MTNFNSCHEKLKGIFVISAIEEATSNGLFFISKINNATKNNYCKVIR